MDHMNKDIDISDKSGRGKRTGFKILAGVLMAFTLLYLFVILAAPVKKINQINRAFNDTITPDKLDKAYPDPDNPDLFILYKEKIFLESSMQCMTLQVSAMISSCISLARGAIGRILRTSVRPSG